jgi:hypothetical protein
MTDTITVKEHRLQWSPGKIANYVPSYVQYLYDYYISALRVFTFKIFYIVLVLIGKYNLVAFGCSVGFAKAKY